MNWVIWVNSTGFGFTLGSKPSDLSLSLATSILQDQILQREMLPYLKRCKIDVCLVNDVYKLKLRLLTDINL